MSKRALLLLLCSTAIGVAGWVYVQRRQQQATVLEHIDALQSCLAADCRLTDKDMIHSLRSLQQAVWDNRNQARGVAVRTEAERIVVRTQSLVDSIRAWRRWLHSQSNDSISQQPGAASYSEATARQLAEHLNRFAGFLAVYLTHTPQLRQLESSYHTDWPFAPDAPLASQLASLTILETHIQELASEALMRHVEKVSYCGTVFYRYYLVAVPASAVVAPGAKYESLLFFAGGRERGQPLRMTVNGKPILLRHNTLGQVEFTVPPLQPGQPDTVRARWRGAIEGQTYRGDTTWRLDVPYLIVKRPAL